MTTLKKFARPIAMTCCLLMLASASFQEVNGQKEQPPRTVRGSGYDYVVIEGDIQVSPEFYRRLQAAARSPQLAPVKEDSKLWPNGVVPFEFDGNVTPDNRTKMIEAMAVLEGVANVDFRRCSNDDCSGNHLHIQDSDSNNSYVGMKGTGVFDWSGSQDLNIFNWNVQFIMVHELMHSLGIGHEQSRSNRDNYIRINCDNIRDGCGSFSDFGKNFKIADYVTGYGRYDFESVMHYDQCAFSKNDICPSIKPEFPDGGVTISVLPPNDARWQHNIGQRNHLSEMDQVGLSFLYPPSDWRFLNVAYDGERGSSNGTFLRPYTNFASGMIGTPEGGTLWLLRTQTIPAVGTYGRRITVRVAPGVEAMLGQ
jgi:Astacin (Peptidase family M12A)